MPSLSSRFRHSLHMSRNFIFLYRKFTVSLVLAGSPRISSESNARHALVAVRIEVTERFQSLASTFEYHYSLSRGDATFSFWRVRAFSITVAILLASAAAMLVLRILYRSRDAFSIRPVTVIFLGFMADLSVEIFRISTFSFHAVPFTAPLASVSGVSADI